MTTDLTIAKKQQLTIAYQAAAQVVKLYGETYLPIFQRLHDELEKQNAAEIFKSLALKIAAE